MSPLAAPDPDEQVRRLLADARHTGPIPGDVAARLDAVVAALHAEAPVDLAARRRGRRARSLLVAAAAVVALGVGVGGVGYLNSASQPDGAASTAGGSAAGSLEPTPEPTAGSESGAAPHVPASPVHLSAAHFADQVRALLRSRRPLAASGDAPSLQAGVLDQGYAARPRCRGPGRGVRVPATYDGARVVLVLRPVRDGVRRVDLYRCGVRAPIRSELVSAR